MRTRTFGLCFALLLLSGCSSGTPQEAETNTSFPIDTEQISESDIRSIAILGRQESLIATLTEDGWAHLPDQNVRGSFNMQTSVDAATGGEMHDVTVIFDELPENASDLQGWLVRSAPVGIIRMGNVMEQDGQFILRLSTPRDVRLYDYFVLAKVGADGSMGEIVGLRDLQ